MLEFAQVLRMCISISCYRASYNDKWEHQLDATIKYIFHLKLVSTCFSWWWAMSRPKHVETNFKWNIYLIVASSWCSHLSWECVVPPVFLQCGPHPEHLGNVSVTLQFWHFLSVFFLLFISFSRTSVLSNKLRKTADFKQFADKCLCTFAGFFLSKTRCVYLSQQQVISLNYGSVPRMRRKLIMYVIYYNEEWNFRVALYSRTLADLNRPLFNPAWTQ